MENRFSAISDEMARLCRRYNRLSEINSGYLEKIKTFQRIRNTANRKKNWKVSDDYSARIDTLFSRWNIHSDEKERITAHIHWSMDAFRVFGYEIRLVMTKLGFSRVATFRITDESGKTFSMGIFEPKPGDQIYSTSTL